jgi:hypothetical protein
LTRIFSFCFYRVAMLICMALLFISSPAKASTLFDFEGIGDGVPVDTFYSAAIFADAVAVEAGFSLNDAEFPPNDAATGGDAVAVPDGNGPMSMQLASAVTSFQGFFTHDLPVELDFFLAGSLVGSANSVFANNLALSGDPGSSPNELISFSSSGGFDDVVFNVGAATAVDDITVDGSRSSAAPEPSTALLIPAAAAALIWAARRKK